MKIKMSTLTAALAAFTLVGTTYAAPITTTLDVVSDTMIRDGSSYVDVKLGTTDKNRMLVGQVKISGVGKAMRGLIGFDTSSISVSAGYSASVTGVTLAGTIANGGSTSINLHKYGYNFDDANATWNNPDGVAGGDTTPGGDYDTTVLANSSSGTFNLNNDGLTAVQSAVNADEAINFLLKRPSISNSSDYTDFKTLEDGSGFFKLSVTYDLVLVESTWNSGSGNWSDTGAWSGSNWVSGKANFTSPGTINVDQDVTVVGMDFAAGSYTLAESGGKTITLTNAIALNSDAVVTTTAPMTITEDTAVSGGGVLLLNGAVTGDDDGTTETLTVGSGTAFGGTGTIGDGTNNIDLTFAGDSLFYVLDPNNPLTVDDGATVTFDTGFSLESLTGNISSLGPGTYTLIDGNFTLAYNGSNWGETNAGKLNGLDAYFKEGSFDLVLQSANIPEPSTILLAGLGLAGLVSRRRRRTA